MRDITPAPRPVTSGDAATQPRSPWGWMGVCGAALLAVGGYAAGMALWRAPQEGWPLFAMGGIAMVLLGGLQLQRAWHYRRAGPSGPAFWLDRSDGGQ